MSNNDEVLVNRDACFEKVVESDITHSYINYTEYLFKMIDLAIELKSPEQSIRIFNIYPNYYHERDDIILQYKDQYVEILDYNLYFKPDEEGNIYKYELEDEADKKAILLFPTTARTLTNFQCDIESIFDTYMANEILFVMPIMCDFGKNIKTEIEKCKQNNSISFKLSHMIDKLFMNDAGNLRKHYTSPLMMENLFYPLNRDIYDIELLLCDHLIGGLEHFLVRIKYNDSYRNGNLQGLTSDIPLGDKYVSFGDQRGLYYCYNGVSRFLSEVVDEGNFELREKIVNLNYDRLVFNRTSAYEDFGIDHFFHIFAPYIRPNTKIVIIEEDMLKILEDFGKISKNDPSEYWNLNTLLFGHNKIFNAMNNYENPDCSEINRVFTTPDLFDIYMTQEGLFKKFESTEPLKFSFSVDNKYTFMREYIRI